jgi:farnesyl-diphosphate farnesyltransferase
VQTGDVDPDKEKKKVEDAEAKRDIFFLLIAVIGTLLVISALMVHLLIPSQPSH